MQNDPLSGSRAALLEAQYGAYLGYAHRNLKENQKTDPIANLAEKINTFQVENENKIAALEERQFAMERELSREKTRNEKLKKDLCCLKTTVAITTLTTGVTFVYNNSLDICNAIVTHGKPFIAQLVTAIALGKAKSN